MTINYTTLLGLAKPVTGTESGAWGDVVNDQITSLLEDAVANAATVNVGSGNVTLTDNNGAADQSRMAILLVTGSPGTSRNIVAPSISKWYIVRNGSDSPVVVKGSATTGVTISASQAALVAWGGSDFVLISTTDAAKLSGLGTGVATALGQNVTGSGGIVLAASPTMTGTTTVGELTIGGATKETVYALSTTTPPLDPSNGGIQTWTLSGNSTPTDSLASGEALLLMIDDGSAAYTITWPSVTWKTNLGNAPTLNTTGYTAIVLWKVSTTLYGARVGNA